MSVTATFSPQHPGRGQLATVTIDMRNDGAGAVDGLVLTDEVSRSTELRSASSPAGDCSVGGRTVTCLMDRLEPGESAPVSVRVLVVDEPASNTLVQRISLSTGDSAEVAEQSISTLVEPPSQAQQLLDLPGPTVTLVVFVTFVLAARSGSGAVTAARR
jgi:hypothetical protein